MKIRLYKFSIILLLIVGCGKAAQKCKFQGQIVGYDGTECMCCPGWIIKANEDSIKILSLPNETELWEIARSKGYPIDIEIEYQSYQGDCDHSYKELLCFELRE